ncbi:DUF5329 domain-containing protein [Lysobacter hankyongensis]|uniref:YfeK family protein n=1 Tax=Lysobacter hankyongensis TaxID=1176535 RepID=A0ABP9BWY4_9GAMM
MRAWLACALLLAATMMWAAARPADAAPSPQAQREIDALIAGLGASGCAFERNGRWYDAKTAQAHLQKKYDYLRKRDMADTAELFIERAASESSMSGKPYRVRCAGKAAEPSAQWFRQRLQALRAAPKR